MPKDALLQAVNMAFDNFSVIKTSSELLANASNAKRDLEFQKPFSLLKKEKKYRRTTLEFDTKITRSS